MQGVEAKAQDMEAPAQSIAFFSNGNNLKYAVIFAHKGKSNTSFGTVKGLLLFVCTHNINKTLCFYKIKKTMIDGCLKYKNKGEA